MIVHPLVLNNWAPTDFKFQCQLVERTTPCSVCVCVNALSRSKFYNLQVSSVPGDYVWSDLDSWCTYFIPISHTFSLCLHLLFWSFYLLFMQFLSLQFFSPVYPILSFSFLLIYSLSNLLSTVYPTLSSL